MESEFWINAWNEGRTNFHQEDFNEKLLEFFPLLAPTKGQKVLVPLCGKSKDLFWLHHQNLQVHGVELHEQAVQTFFTENKLAPVKKTQDKDFINYTFENIVISVGDFFKLDGKNTYDLIYDRAALVALPAPMRKTYVQTIKQSLKVGGKCLLIVYQYDQTKMEGPPFSVDANEIHELYEDQFTIKLMESKKPSNEGPRLAAVEGLKQKIYILKKIR